MGGWFGGALVTMQALGEMQSRLEYGLLGDDHQDDQLAAPAVAAPAPPRWRKALARALIGLSDRIAPELRPLAPDPCPC